MKDTFRRLKEFLSGEQEEERLSATGMGTLEQFREETEENLDRQYDGPRQTTFAVDLVDTGAQTLQVYQEWQERPFYELELETGTGRIGVDAVTAAPEAYDALPEQHGQAPSWRDAVATVNYRVVNSPYFRPERLDDLPAAAITAGGHSPDRDTAYQDGQHQV